MPGCEKLELTGDNRYEGVLKIRVGPVQGTFNGIITLSNIAPPDSYHMEVDGKGPAGFVKGNGNLRLEEQTETTTMHYEGDVQVGGRLASVGQRLLDTSARAIIRQSLEGLDQQVQARAQAQDESAETSSGTTTTPFPSIEAPSQSQFALGVARNFLEEIAPPERRPELVTKGLLLLGGFLFLQIVTHWWMNRLARRVAAILDKRR
jgi:carbon monoxide dehydrogenase subunit G